MGSISFYEAPDGRFFEAGAHECYVGMLFADGAVGSGTEQRGVIVSMSADGSPARFEDWEYRPDADVVGWVWVCECGWRGQPWQRVVESTDADVEARRAYSPDIYAPLEVEEDPLWSAHARPFAVLAYVSDCASEVHAANTRLGDAVAAARDVGAAWEGIGRAAGMSRQAAHERWSDRDAG